MATDANDSEGNIIEGSNYPATRAAVQNGRQR